jgi:hypothetical protein
MGMIEAAIVAQLVAEARLGRAAAGSVTQALGEFHDRSDRARAIHAARTKWLQRRGAEASFPCGVVRTDAVGFPPEARERREELSVIAAVLPEDVVFLVDPPEVFPAPDPVEAGSVARADLRGASVVALDGSAVPEPASESFDREPDVVLVVSFADGDAIGEQRLVFRSAWVAWQAAHRLRAATVSPT